jgi:hypothetical protein
MHWAAGCHGRSYCSNLIRRTLPRWHQSYWHSMTTLKCKSASMICATKAPSRAQPIRLQFGHSKSRKSMRIATRKSTITISPYHHHRDYNCDHDHRHRIKQMAVSRVYPKEIFNEASQAREQIQAMLANDDRNSSNSESEFAFDPMSSSGCIATLLEHAVTVQQVGFKQRDLRGYLIEPSKQH